MPSDRNIADVDLPRWFFLVVLGGCVASVLVLFVVARVFEPPWWFAWLLWVAMVSGLVWGLKGLARRVSTDR